MSMNAQGLASLGRKGDDQIGHLTTGEKVLPLPVAQDPSVQKVINQSFSKYGLDADQYTVGHANNSVNPNTDLAEFGFSFKKLGKSFRKISQVVGTVVGFALGGPTGAAIGSSLGGANRRGKITLKDAFTDAVGGYVAGSIAVGAGVNPAQGFKSLNPLGKDFMLKSSNLLGPTSASVTNSGIGGFFQDVGANAANFVTGSKITTLPSVGDAYAGLSFAGKAGVTGIGALAAGKMGLFEEPELQGPPEGMGLSEQQQQYLTRPLTPATTMPGIGGIGGSSSGQVGQYQGGAGIGSLNDPQQQLLDYLEEQKRKYLMQFPEFQTNPRQFGYNKGGPVGYNKGGKVNQDGVAIDDIPAMLTEDEHVLTRDAIKGLGNGDIEQGHQIAKQINDSAEAQEQLEDKVLQRKYFMQYPEFKRGAA